jgi:hypothetical protein
MGLLSEQEGELEIFETVSIEQLIQFKWEMYARRHHLLGCIMHLVYVQCLINYTNLVYILNEGSKEDQVLYAYLLAGGILYPALYDWTQLFKGGLGEYLNDKWNYADIVYIWSSIGNIYCQMFLSPFILLSKILMIIVVILALIKTFFFLRIFESLSPIVTMLTNVIYDLRIFLFFYTILLVLFSLLFGILGVGNVKVPGGFKEEWEGEDKDFPGEEYKYTGLLVGNFLYTLRASLGDFDFAASVLLDQPENIMFWIIWYLIVVVTCIIFLNFIIAEAGASYTKVSESLQAFISMQKANMIDESEGMTFSCFRNSKKSPKYIVIR